MEHRLDGELGHRCCVITRCEGVCCGVAWGYWVFEYKTDEVAEFTSDIEALIEDVVKNGTPLRKSTAQKIEEMKATHKVQELPAKLPS